MEYKFTGVWDYGDPAIFSPQPASDGIQILNRQRSVSDKVFPQGYYTEWKFSRLTPDEFQYLNETIFGLSIVDLSTDCTIDTSLGNDRTTFERWNAVIYYPDPSPRYRLGFYEDVTYRINLVNKIGDVT